MGAHITSPGYSLVEVLVVLAIMSLIALVAVPAATATLERMTLTADARTLATELRALRTIALDRQTDIVIAEGPGGLAVSRGGVIALSSATRVELLGTGSAKRFVLRWDGTSSGVVTLSRGAAKLRLTADQLTGRFTIESVQ